MNPFSYGSEASGSAFFGRKEQLDELRSHILSGQNVVLYGERRMGKTSLALEAVRSIGDYDVARVNLDEVKTVEDVIYSISAAVQRLQGKGRPKETIRSVLTGLRGFRGTYNIPSPTGQPGGFALTYEQQQDSFDNLFERIERTFKEKPFVVFLDEFQGILGCENSARIVALLRGYIQHQPQIPYLFAGSIRHRMYEMFMSPGNPFYKSALPMEIGPLPQDEICAFLTSIFADQNQSNVESGTLERAYELVDGTTGDLQQICSTIWGLLSPKSAVDLEMLEKSIQKIVNIFEKKYVEDCRRLTRKQATILEGIALFDGRNLFSVDFQAFTGQPIGTIQQAVKRFEENQVLFQPYGESGFRFIDPFFQIYLRAKVAAKTPSTAGLP